MNIFYLDRDPKKAARMHCDKHIPRMATEAAMLLSIAHRRRGYRGNEIYRESKTISKSLGPLVWIMESRSNYRWTVTMALELCAEHVRRGRAKGVTKPAPWKCLPVLRWLRDHEPDFNAPTAMIPATEREHKDFYAGKEKDPVKIYRRYYILDKHMFAKWPEGKIPKWYKEGLAKMSPRALARADRYHKARRKPKSKPQP
ncbi:MAG: hypothetical protein WCS52_04960 [bacterium]